ncbi:MAG: hypothetical protein ACLS43_08620 [Evtepia gabavorous]
MARLKTKSSRGAAEKVEDDVADRSAFIDENDLEGSTAADSNDTIPTPPWPPGHRLCQPTRARMA